MMTLDEAIEHAEWAAQNCEGECSDEHRQLAEWLRELGDEQRKVLILMTEANALRAENAKLRELCADMWRDIPKTESCGWDIYTNTCTGSGECIGECSYWYRMNKLGIEVVDE